MKTIRFTSILLLAASTALGAWAADLTVSEHVQGKLDEEITALLDGADFTAVNRLTIAGGDLNMTDAAAIKKCTNVTAIDVSGVAFYNNVMAGNDGGGLFATLAQLQEITLPSTLKQIGKGAFRGCSALQSVLIQDETRAKSNLFSKDNRTITLINAFAFFGCSQLPVGELPSTVENIGKQAFQNCPLVTITEIPGYGVAKLQESTFRETGIRDFTFPASVTQLEKTVFYRDQCDYERTFTFRTAAPALVNNAALNTLFGSVDNTVIRILKQHESSFESWKDVAGKVEFLAQDITVHITGEGTVQVSGDGLASESGDVADLAVITAYEGEHISLSITPADGFKLASVTLGGEMLDAWDDLTIDSQTAKDLHVTFEADQTTAVESVQEDAPTIVLQDGTLTIHGDVRTSARLFDACGHLVMETRDNVLHLSNEKAGLYLLQVNGNTFKVMLRP